MSRAKILIVDDDGISAMLTRKTLEQWGYEVTGLAESFDDALSSVNVARPDIVLMDIVIKGDRDGIATAAEIRARFGIPVIYLSAHAEDEIIERAKITEPFAYVLKPYKGKDLLSAIEMTLYKSKIESQMKENDERMRQFQKLESLGRFAGGIAHEFNSLLTVIIGYAKHAQQQIKEESPVLDSLIEIHKTAKKAALLTKQILAFSRNQMFHLQDCDLNILVENTVRFAKPLLGETIDLRMELSPEPIPVRVDSGQVEQAMVNLLTNARDAMPRGGTITVSASREIMTHSDFERGEAPLITERPTEYATVSVRDTGVGIASADLARVFEPVLSTSSDESRLGLGLAVSYGIIRQHQGFIDVTSEPQKGTVFSIHLPITSPMNQASPVPRDAQLKGHETILIAEDTDLLKKMLKTILSDYGYEILLAGDGDQALQQFRQHRERIRLVMLDMVMPKRTGRQVYEEIALHARDVKFLFTSGYTDDEDLMRFAREHRVEIIPKPYDPDELAQKIRAMLDSGGE